MQLCSRVDNTECSSVKKLNTVTNPSGSNEFCLTDWKTVSQCKRYAKIDTDSHQHK
jgi:hypothetical protein